MKKETQTHYYENGNKASETPYVNNQIHGLEIWWYENGKKWDEIPHKNNIEHGSMVEFKY